jgi:maltose O-acetyltransferase
MGKLLAAMKLEATVAARHLWFNTLAGSPVTPAPIRYLMCRAGGIHTQSMAMFSGIKVTGRHISIGARTFINHGAYLDAGGGRIQIGDRCLVGPQVMILTATHEIVNGHVARRQTNRDVTVGNDVWLGARSTILPGVTIGTGCVIAAGAVVTRDCEPGGLYGGVPARRIRNLTTAPRSGELPARTPTRRSSAGQLR